MPLFKTRVAVRNAAAPGYLRKTESLSHFGLDEKRSTLVSLVGVFLIDSRMVFPRDFATFHHEIDQGEQLRVGVAGIMNMSRGLNDCQQ